MTYEATSELAVLFASQMDETYKGLFFQKTQQKFVKELNYLKDETLYKIVWSLVKSQTVVVAAESARWNAIKQVIKTRAKELDPKVMADFSQIPNFFLCNPFLLLLQFSRLFQNPLVTAALNQ